MDTVTTFFVCVLLLVIVCLVLDHWVLPREPESSAVRVPQAKPAPEVLAQESVLEEAQRRLEEERRRLHRKNNPFSLNAWIAHDEDSPYLVATCWGKIPWHESGKLYATLKLADVTDGLEQQVLCIHADMRDAASGSFAYTSRLALPSDGFIEGSTKLLRIPLASLTAPYAGRRRLRLSCVLAPSGSVPEDVAKHCEAVVEVDMANPGYADKLGEGRIYLQRLELAMACGLAGRRKLGLALKLLGPWIDEVLDEAKSRQAPYYDELLLAFDHLWSEELGEGYEVEKACLAIAASGRSSVDETLGCCLLMATADGSWPREAVRLIRTIGGLMGLSAAEVQSRLDRHLLGETLELDRCDWESLMGLDPAWGASRLRKHLGVRFDHWNSRAPSAHTTSEQARIRTILDAIAKLRQKYS